MNLADMLGYADIQQLDKIALSYGCECDGHSKNELIQTILSTIGRKECINRLVQRMSVEDIRFVNAILFDNSSGYSLEELTARARQARFAAPGEDVDASREMIVSYKQRGWLFNGVSAQTRFLFHVPEDLKKRIVDSLAERFEEKLDYVDEPEAYRDEQTLLANDILYLLRYAAQEEAPLTADGTVYKRTLLAILNGFAVKEEPVGKVGFRFGYGRRFREYPDRFSFIYDYCYYNELISEDSGMLQLTEQGRRIVETRQKEELGQIFRLWIRLYKGPVPNVLPVSHWVIRLSRRWVSAKSLIDCLSPLVKPYYYDSSEAVLDRRIMRMMMHLGLLQIGEHPQIGTVVRATRVAEPIVKGLKVDEDDVISLPEWAM